MKDKKRKAERLLDSIGEIDDALLADAVAYRSKRRIVMKVVALAAVLAVLITAFAAAFVVLDMVQGKKSDKLSDTNKEYGDVSPETNDPQSGTSNQYPECNTSASTESEWGTNNQYPEWNTNASTDAEVQQKPGDGGMDEGFEEGMEPEYDMSGDANPEGVIPSEPTPGTEDATEGIGDDSNVIEPDVTELITNPFINTADNNTSTFSADVDTASYTYFRSLVNSGYSFKNLRNSGSAFRTEEFINYFRYNSTAPREVELFGVYTEIVPCPWNESTVLLRMTLQAENVVNTKGNNLVFLIDVSGSMSSNNKLPLLKKAFSYLVGNLGPNDTVSIVTYSGREAVVLDGCKGTSTNEIMDAINSLVASGSTNGEAGLTMAYQIAEKHFIEGGNNRIIMASDGDLNVGISSSSELKHYIEGKRDQGIYLSVLGFGTGNYRDANMEALADNGNGVYYYIDGESEAEKVFGTDLTGTLYTVANDVKLQLVFDTEFVESYRLIGYDNRVLDNEDFENDFKDAGEVGAGHQVTVCYELLLKPCDAYVTNYIKLNVRYKNPGEALSLLNEYNIGSNSCEASDDTRFISCVVELVALLRNPNYTGAITLHGILDELDSLTLTDSYKLEFRELVRKLVQNQ